MELSIVVPAKNEVENIEPLLMRLESAVAGIPAEVVFVDDSSDATPQRIRDLSKRFAFDVSLIARPPARQTGGLAGAVVEGFALARGNWVCVMDADLQHPPELIPRMLARAESSGADIVLGSRLAKGGSTAGLGGYRSVVSRVLAWTTRIVFWKRLRGVSDPLTGLFLVRRRAIDVHRLAPDGFKILLEILIRFPKLRVAEIPFQFGRRFAGRSKAGFGEATRLFLQYARLSDARVLRFLAVGLSGIVVNSLVLGLATGVAGLHYLASAALATQVSTAWNFSLTDTWVFRGRLLGRSRLRRAGMYFLMNNAALALRAPMMFALTSRLRLHYLLSNLVTLGILTLLRYASADRWIWLRALPRRQPSAP